MTWLAAFFLAAAGGSDDFEQTLRWTNTRESLELVNTFRVGVDSSATSMTFRRRLLSTTMDGNIIPTNDRTPPVTWSAPADGSGRWRWPEELPEGEEYAVLATLYGLSRAEAGERSEVLVRLGERTARVRTKPAAPPSADRYALEFRYVEGPVNGQGTATVRRSDRRVLEVRATYTGLRLPDGELGADLEFIQKPSKR